MHSIESTIRNYKGEIQMADFYVNNNAQPNGDHEVHEAGCSWLAMVNSKKHLGNFSNCRDAVVVAKRTYSTANGCVYCAKACHTS
jgi:hypothetical protein